MVHRLTLIICFCFLSAAAFSQVLFGVHAGVHNHTVDYKIKDTAQTVTGEFGYQAGVNLKVFFEGRLFFNPFLFYSLKKYKVQFNKPSYPPSDAAINNDVTMHTVEFAPLLQFDFSNNPSHFFVRFGPSLDVAISGTEKFVLNTNNTMQQQSMVFNNSQYSRFAASGVIHLGYEIKNSFSIFAHYEHGFVSRNNADDGPKIFHRTIGISLGKYLGKNPNVFDTSVKE
jgi:hypothetical protein